MGKPYQSLLLDIAKSACRCSFHRLYLTIRGIVGRCLTMRQPTGEGLMGRKVWANSCTDYQAAKLVALSKVSPGSASMSRGIVQGPNGLWSFFATVQVLIAWILHSDYFSPLIE